ncbi:MAG: shikimate kinase [Clostridia bacterium]|jgi:shikimate kinase|nr:shikimate kinase [Spirochaetia bacterium]
MEKRTVRRRGKPQCVALIGLPASGKSAVGSALARRLGLSFVDLDEQIVAGTGRSIAEIFRLDGEEAFRLLESESLEGATRGGRIILSTGGGCVLAPGNRSLLKERCTVVWLDVSPEVAAARADPAGNREPHRGAGQKTKPTAGLDTKPAAGLDAKPPAVRPLLADGNVLERMCALDAIRRPLYRECADIIVQAEGKSPIAIVEELYAVLD